ncbi:hypothetical protein ACQJBY_037305 [Aegilops geniculata]
MVYGVANGVFQPEQGAAWRGVDASGAWTDAADEARPRARTDSRRRNGGDDEGGEDAPSRAAALGRVEVEPPSATGETVRRRGGDDEGGPARTAKPAAAR